VYINFPASCPWVTAVGGIWLGDLDMGPLEVDNMSTGGFSHWFEQPDYQQAAVKSWIDNNKITPNSEADFSKRAVPDIVAQSSFIQI